MSDDRIENLKRTIKRTYKRYSRERIDGNATIIDVLKLFNISIDESRIEDYVIESIDFSIPSIEVLDKKTNAKYRSEYADKANLLNYSGKITFTDGDYELIFEKNVSNYTIVGLNAKSNFAIRYAKNVYEKDRQEKQILLSKIFRIKNNNETFEQLYTYSPQHLIKYDDNQDKYCYIQNGNVIYGVNSCEVKELIHYLYGICFESTSLNVSEYLPYNIELKDFPELTNNEMYSSGIVFRGGTGNEIHHVFTIFKTKNHGSNTIELEDNKRNYDIYLKYDAIKWEPFENENGIPDYRTIIVTHKETRYPSIDDGNITSQEIRNIIEELDVEYAGNVFIQFIINELKTFANKMDVQKGILEEEIEPLSPRLFINKSFNEIYTLVNANKDEYFNLISEQFISATNIKKEKTPTLIKALKENDDMKKLSERKDSKKDKC